MIEIMWWILFGLIVGSLAKVIHPGDEPSGYLPTIAIGVAGSFVGGVVNWLIGMGSQPFEFSGVIMSTLGGVLCCSAWRYYKLKYQSAEPKSFFTGKTLK